MKKSTKKFWVGAATLLLSLSAGAASQWHVHAAINPDRYGIDVFPTRQNHYQFAYQLRRKGHNSRIYYARRSSKIGRALFTRKHPNADYANYMLKRHPRRYRSIVKRLDRTSKRTKRTSQHQKRTRRSRRTSKRNTRKQNVRRKNRQVRHGRKNAKNRSKLLPSKFTRSNNQKSLKRSGYFDARPLGGNFIFNKYAPNDRRAVVPQRFNSTNWVKGVFGQSNPSTYTYIAKQHGWKLGK